MYTERPRGWKATSGWLLPLVHFYLYGPLMYLFTTAILFLEITLLAYMSGIFVNSMNRKANFGQQWRISTYSFTLAVTFFTFMNFIQVPVIGDVYVKWFITLVMIYLTVKEMPISKNKQNTIQP